jgi:hypothetical protein
VPIALAHFPCFSSFSHPWLAFLHCLALLASLSHASAALSRFGLAFSRFLASLSHALAAFRHSSLIAASAIQEQWLHSTGTSTKHVEPSRVRPTSIDASRRCTASLSIGSGLAEARQTQAFERLLYTFGFMYIRSASTRSSAAD